MNYGVSLKRIFCRLSVTSCSKLFSFTGGQVTFGEWYETYGLSYIIKKTKRVLVDATLLVQIMLLTLSPFFTLGHRFISR